MATMAETRVGRLEVASLPRRLAAALIDMVVLVPPILVVGGGAVFLYMRVKGRDDDVNLDPRRPFEMSTRWQVVMWIGSGAAEVLCRNWRSPGYRAMGLRRVDVRTGGPVSARNALLYHAITATSGWISRQLMRPWQAGRAQRREAIWAEIKEAKGAHPNDPSAQREAMQEIFKQHRVRPVGSCAPPLLSTVVMQSPAVFSPRHQTIAQRLAGIVIVAED